MPNRDISNMRKDYTLRTLEKSDLDSCPLTQFKHWFDEAINSDVYEPNAMSLATVDKNCQPTCRIVLLKDIDHGFIFYTNYESRKGRQIGSNPFAALTMWWDKLERQVRVEGRVEKVSKKQSDEYFSSRPLGSQISAAVSPQSQIVESYERLVNFKDQIDEATIVRPESWGGYRVMPLRIEFWQGRTNRFHDRFVYSRDDKDEIWLINRLGS